MVELVLGALGGVLLSPLAALVGALIGWRVGERRIGLGEAIALVGLASGGAVCLFAALNGGLIDESGSAGPLLFVGVLGALAGSVATACFAGVRRFVG